MGRRTTPHQRRCAFVWLCSPMGLGLEGPESWRHAPQAWLQERRHRLLPLKRSIRPLHSRYLVNRKRLIVVSFPRHYQPRQKQRCRKCARAWNSRGNSVVHNLKKSVSRGRSVRSHHVLIVRPFVATWTPDLANETWGIWGVNNVLILFMRPIN